MDKGRQTDPMSANNEACDPGIRPQHVREASSILEHHEAVYRPSLHLLDGMPEVPLESPKQGTISVGVVWNRCLVARNGYV